MTDAKSNRFTARYQRRRDRGDVYVSVWFTPATLAVLRALQRRTGGTIEATIASALLNASVNPPRAG